MFEPAVRAVMERVDRLRHETDDSMQIPRDEALVLAQIGCLRRCRSLCEIGVSYGFSTLHLAAAAASNGGHVQAFDISQKKVDAATRHLAEAGLSEVVTLHLGDARELVAAVAPAEPYDFAFIDATKSQSFAYLAALLPKLAPGAVLATDNTGTHPAELAPFVEHLRGLPDASSCAVPVGNGFELTILP